MEQENIRNVDIAIIGAGSAGMNAYKAARQYTDSIVIIENGSYGTTCADVGCMPSKLLIAAAEAAHSIEQAPAFGVKADAPIVDGRAVMARVRSERDRFVGFVRSDVMAWPEEQRILGHATFLDPHTIDVGGHTRVKARSVVIATGSRPVWPSAWDHIGDRLIVNDDVFSWEDLPKSVAVFGNGVIGLELAQSLHRLGVRMRLFGLGGLVGPLTDPRVKQSAREIFESEYAFDPEADVISIERIEDRVRITYRDKGQQVTEEFDYLLAATGRRPNTDKLALENAGVKLDKNGTPLDYDRSTMRLGDSSIFIAGDAAPDVPLLHEASDMGRIAGENAARFPFVRERPRRAPLAVAFSDPQIAMVGESFEELTRRDANFVVGEVDFRGQGRARVMLKNAGLLRVYADRNSGAFLGAEMVGPSAEHLAHLLAWSLQSQRTIQQMVDSPFYHPVIEEGLRTALRMARDQLALHSETPCFDCRTAA